MLAYKPIRTRNLTRPTSGDTNAARQLLTLSRDRECQALSLSEKVEGFLCHEEGEVSSSWRAASCVRSADRAVIAPGAA